jgi:hypothetical protein
MMDDYSLSDLIDSEYLSGTIVPNSLLPHIGSVAVYYSNLDWSLSEAIWKLLGLTERKGQIVTQFSASFASRVEMFKVLTTQRYKTQKRRSRIAEFCRHLRIAGDDRNRLMHDVIFYSEGVESGAKAAIKTKRSNPLTNSTNEYFFDRATICDLRDRLSELWFLFHCFRSGRNDWLVDELPSLDKSPTQILLLRNEALQRERKHKSKRRISRQKPRSRH